MFAHFIQSYKMATGSPRKKRLGFQRKMLFHKLIDQFSSGKKYLNKSYRQHNRGFLEIEGEFWLTGCLKSATGIAWGGAGDDRLHIQQNTVPSPIILLNVPLDTHVGQNPVYKHLKLELNSILHTNIKDFCQDFNTHWIFHKCN